MLQKSVHFTISCHYFNFNSKLNMPTDVRAIKPQIILEFANSQAFPTLPY